MKVKLIICLCMIIGLFITINLWHYLPKEIEYKETVKIVREPYNCGEVLNCVIVNSTKICKLPDNKNLSITEIKNYNITIK